MELKRLSIRQTFARLESETQPARYELRSPRGDLSIDQHPAEMSIRTEPGRLEVDSSAAWMAYGKGGNLEFSHMIYSQMPSILLQGIAKIVEEGHRLADITNPVNGFADIAKSSSRYKPQLRYTGDASFLNVRMRYTPGGADIRIEPQKADITYTPSKVQVEYERGKVHFHMERYQSIDIRVSDYNLYE